MSQNLPKEDDSELLDTNGGRNRCVSHAARADWRLITFCRSNLGDTLNFVTDTQKVLLTDESKKSLLDRFVALRNTQPCKQTDLLESK